MIFNFHPFHMVSHVEYYWLSTSNNPLWLPFRPFLLSDARMLEFCRNKLSSRRHFCDIRCCQVVYVFYCGLRPVCTVRSRLWHLPSVIGLTLIEEFKDVTSLFTCFGIASMISAYITSSLRYVCTFDVICQKLSDFRWQLSFYLRLRAHHDRLLPEHRSLWRRILSHHVSPT